MIILNDIYLTRCHAGSVSVPDHFMQLVGYPDI